MAKIKMVSGRYICRHYDVDRYRLAYHRKIGRLTFYVEMTVYYYEQGKIRSRYPKPRKRIYYDLTDVVSWARKYRIKRRK